MRMMTKGAAACAALLGSACAQDALTSDRPGFSTSPSTVAQGRLLIEAGLDLAEGGTFTAPLALVRYGVGPDTEVRAGWSGLALDGAGADGLGGSVEVKHTLGSGQRGATGLLLTATLPPSGGVDPSAGFLWTRGLGPASLFGTATVGRPEADGDRRWVGTNAVGVSGSLSERVGVFAEHFVSVTEGPGAARHVIDAGLTYLVTNDLQLDLTAGVGVGGGAGDFVGAGIARRF